MHIPDNNELMQIIGSTSAVHKEIHLEDIDRKLTKPETTSEKNDVHEIKDHEVPLPGKDKKQEDKTIQSTQSKLKPLMKKKRFSFFKLIIVVVLSLILSMVMMMILNYKLFATKLAEDLWVVIIALLFTTIIFTGLFYLFQFIIKLIIRKIKERKEKKEMTNAPDVPSQILPGQEKSP